MRIKTGLGLALVGLTLLGTAAARAEWQTGAPEIQSVAQLAFGPDGVLLVGDTNGAALFAIDTGDRGPRAEGAVKIEKLNEKVAALLGTSPQQITINDVAVNPASGRVYLAVSRGQGAEAKPVILRAEPSGKLAAVGLEKVRYAKAALPNAPSPGGVAKANRPSPRQESITDIAFVDGRVFVAGLSNEEFSSRLLAIPYPFENKEGTSASVEIFHGAHGRFETSSPVRTFVPYQADGKSYLLAAYTCTPLVKFPISELKAGSHVKGTTIAELGNRNRPLDMIVYEKDGKPFLLLANNSRGVMKIPAGGVTTAEGIVEPVKTEKKGIGYESLAALKGVLHLDRLDKGHALILVQAEDGAVNLETIALP